ncbi:DUF5134 domain-containing protein [Streptacidiphilus monticola]|jgi:hypothetical protein|uniref:DUF5134 domain-containing protein n=1 Tax=Streptacidiphilus monticola TaxID=2161674 RepID=A0ABW1G9B4_9ACTN
MRGSAVVAWLLVLLVGSAGSYCLARVCLRRGAPVTERQADASEAVMGLGMAVMALPHGWGMRLPAPLWLTVFGAAAAWSLWCAVRHRGARGHHGYHAAGHAAMLYMAVAMAASPHDGMPGMTAGAPAVTGPLLLFFCAAALRFGLRLSPAAGPDTSPTALLPHACRVIMALGMSAMLVTL